MPKNEPSLTRVGLARAVSNELGLSLSDSAQLVGELLGHLMEALVRGETVKISGFGAFHQRTRPEQMGRNPKTMEPAIVPESRRIYFAASGKMRAQVAQLPASRAAAGKRR